MKKLYYTRILILFLFCQVSIAQVGVGTTLPAGALDITSTTTGFIPPRVALAATNLQAPIINPQTGVLTNGTIVWNTATAGATPNNVTPGLYYWLTNRWVAFAGASGGLDWSLTGNSGTTAGTNFLGTTDSQDIRFHTNSIERTRILSGGTIGINSVGSAFAQVTAIGDGSNDVFATQNTDGVANGLWARNFHATGTSVLGSSNGSGGVYPTLGAGVAGYGADSHGISGITGNGAPNNALHNGHSAGSFSLDSDANSATANSSAFAKIAGKDEQIVAPLGASSRRILYGGYFVSGIAAQTYSYVALKYNHNNDATATGGTDYKIVGNGVVSTLIPDEDFNARVMFCPEAPEVLFEDYGMGKLQNGVAFIALDKIVSKSLKIDEKHPLKVFIQLEGECNGVFVTEKTKEGFKVKELNNGNSNISFSWHIVGNRADSLDQNGNVTSHYQDLRLPYGPKPLQQPKLTSKTEKK